MRQWLVVIALAAAGSAHAQGKAPGSVPEKPPAKAAVPAAEPAAIPPTPAPPPTLAALKQRVDIGADLWQLGAHPLAGQLAAKQKALPRKFRFLNHIVLDAKSKKPVPYDLAGINETIPLGEGFVLQRTLGSGSGQNSDDTDLSWLGLVPMLSDSDYSAQTPRDTTTFRRKRHLVTKRIIASTLDPAKFAPGYSYALEVESVNEFLSTRQAKNEKAPRPGLNKTTSRLKHECKFADRISADTLKPKFKGSALPIDCTIKEGKDTFKDKLYYLEDYGFAIWARTLSNTRDLKDTYFERTVELVPD